MNSGVYSGFFQPPFPPPPPPPPGHLTSSVSVSVWRRQRQQQQQQQQQPPIPIPASDGNSAHRFPISFPRHDSCVGGHLPHIYFFCLQKKTPLPSKPTHT
ncbi:hypothetical protein K504DRAFT_302972 [Pleomassaria siparia CBS 279.74]|uniref:Uncharacterized protein n=1 Tax=Pleomassaria siparia CBS 279.74 TaxID=1314801 RepID=A0A6G1K640_9PLEO|nr:hypothetical protein K504DRAFT_302972 [Pleomassaria siparia CBS 279.74]